MSFIVLNCFIIFKGTSSFFQWFFSADKFGICNYLTVGLFIMLWRSASVFHKLDNFLEFFFRHFFYCLIETFICVIWYSTFCFELIYLTISLILKANSLSLNWKYSSIGNFTLKHFHRLICRCLINFFSSIIQCICLWCLLRQGHDLKM